MAVSPYLFVFGRTPDLAFLELLTLFPQATRIDNEIARVEMSHVPDIEQLMDRLGGTIKIVKPIGELSILQVETVAPFLVAHEGRITFGFSYYGFTNPPKTLASEIKKVLENQGLKARYIASEHGTSLSSVVVDKGHVEEFVIVKQGDTYSIGKTLTVQRYEAWNSRDYDRPYADAKSGMLPPKVARMIVNIGMGKTYDMPIEKSVVLDPFCGMGTILAEGYMIACKVYGSDTDALTVKKASGNLAWLTKAYPATDGEIGSLRVSDAVHVSELHAPDSIDLIATEPYMGTTNIANLQQVDIQKIRNTIKGLEKLYIGCLRDWHKILIPGGRVVIALPAYAVSRNVYFVKKVVDMCEILGYTIEDGPIEYSRPQAVVKRMFYILRKNT